MMKFFVFMSSKVKQICQAKLLNPLLQTGVFLNHYSLVSLKNASYSKTIVEQYKPEGLKLLQTAYRKIPIAS